MDGLPPLAIGHPLVGEPCTLCSKPLNAGEIIRPVLNSKLSEQAFVDMKAGRSYTAAAVVAHQHCPGPVTLTCTCCGFEQTFPDCEAAFQAGWDEPDHLPSWPLCCPLCPGVAAMGMVDHTEAHERWKREGRPPRFEG